MNHLVALLIKYTAISAVLLFILGILGDATIPRILVISLLITGAAYVVGDLFILPQYGNAIATITDFGMSFLGIWFLNYLLIDTTRNIAAEAFFSAAIIGVVEILFHIYMKKLVLNHTTEKAEFSTLNHNRYATEFSEEHTDFTHIKNVNETNKELTSKDRIDNVK
ncbi:YndM family protein [Bacillus sp. DX1.1]|uniref:YndM family protein n=1 Tax=unclassified Bacillus (in: firmicutes) TaxID=185979 RepID=UPI002570BA1C|nr:MULTISPECIES: YndM family protein [unclassified Bacillus (in: firmicutes)]MDM5154946.1 YndM family protein [Bacillus sp. DX1.1]WJE83811.1 YndM family protein [Bacillus sp. DX3.1]